MYKCFVLALVITFALFLAIPSPRYYLYEDPKVLEVPPILERIAECESGNTQARVINGIFQVVRGKVNPKDVGRFQLNEKYWLKKSKELGFNIYTWYGNTQMALWLYEHYGTSPWNWSKPCWASKTLGIGNGDSFEPVRMVS